MATLDNQNDIILQATDYRFVDPLIELATYDSNSAATTITPKFAKTANVAGLLPSLVVIKATMTNTIGTTASLPTPTQYYWEYSTTTNPNTWIAVSPQPTYGVGYNVGTLQVTNALFKTHVGTGNTGVYYRLTLKYAVENDVVGSRFLVSYVAEANTAPLVELSKPTIFIPTTTTTVDFLNSTFDLNVRVGTTYLKYDASVTPAINTFKVGVGVVRVGTTTIGAMTLADRNKATDGTVSANDTAVFADFSGAGTTDFAVLEYPVTITDIDGNTISISIEQSLVKQKTGQDGASAASFTIVNTAPILNKNSAGVISPAELVLTTQFLNITGSITYQWYKNNVLITTTTGVAPNQVVTPVTTSSYSIPLADYASVTSNTYKCVITGTINGVVGSTLSDEVTVPLLVDGSSTIQVLHTNQNFIFTASTTGYAGISFTGGSDTLKVYIGTTALNYNTTGANTYSISSVFTNITTTASFTIGSTNYVVNTPTAMAAETATAVLTITVRNAANVATTITTTINYSLSRAGDIGPSGPSFYIANSAPIFKKNSAGVFSPPSILTLTTQYANIIGPITYQWYKNDSTTAIVGASSSSYPVPIADYASVTSNTYKCTISGTVGSFNVSLSDVVTIPLLIDGSNAIQISNSNENITFSGPETGFSGISFTSGGSVIRVYLGTTLLSYAASGANTFSCTIANTGITVAAGTGTGTTFTIPAPTAMSADTATTVVTVTIRDSAGAVTTPTTTISYSLSRAGADGIGTNGTRTAIMEMYQWSASAPTAFPVGTSTYTWSIGQFSAPATLNSWAITPPAVVVGQTLWVCRTVYADTLSTTTNPTTSITWSATAAYAAGAAGTNGTRTAFLELYIWSAATPIAWPTGSSTYTWTNGTFTAPATPNGWALVPGASTAGFKLYATSVRYSDTGTGGTTSIAWPTTGQVAYVVGAAGDNGAASTIAGPAGNSSRRAYARIAYPTTPTNPVSASITTSGNNLFPSGAAWGASFTTTWTASDPNPASTNTLYQCDGIYNPTVGVDSTIWTTPYISALKVGSLSAITVDTGALTVGTTGNIKGGQTDYNTGTGFFLGYSGTAYKFSIGSSTANMKWDGSVLDVVGGTITGGTIRTGSGTSRVEMSSVTNDLKVYVGGVVAASIGTGTGVAGAGRINASGSTVGGYAIQGTNTGGTGIYGEVTTGDGVAGRASTSGIGVNGYCNGSGTGVVANNTSTGIGLKVGNTGTGNAAEITGNITGIALKVTSTTTNGIEATATSGIAIKGTTSTGNGVTGIATGTAGNGITAQATTGNGLYALNSSSGLSIYALANGAVGTGTNHAFRASNSTRGTAGLVGGSGIFDFYAEGTATNYGPFTGAHDTLMLKNTLVEAGDILVDVKVIGKWTLSNVICESAASTQPNQKAAIGVFVGKVNTMGGSFPNGVNSLDAWELNNIIDTYDYCAMNALGEGQVNVCGENGDIEIGDLIVTSSITGKGMRQADDVVRNYTVAKAREAVTFSAPNEVKTIACIYLCG